MFHTSLGAFRSHHIFYNDFPSEGIDPPFSYLGVPSYNIEALVTQRNASRSGVAPDELLTLEDVCSEEGLGFQRMNLLEEFHEHEDEVEFIDKALVRRGYEYYTYETAHERFVSSVAPNLRDIETFANIPGLGRGLVYRSGYLLSHDPEKLLHILQHVLQVRSIIDLRGFMPLKPGTGHSSEALTRQALFSAYRPCIFDAAQRRWLSVEKEYPDLGRYMDGDKVIQQSKKPHSDFNIYCFNMGFPGTEVSTKLSQLLQPVKRALVQISPISFFVKRSRKIGIDMLDLTPPEHYIIQFLVYGAFFINTVLRTLLRVSRKPDVFGLMKLRIGCLLSKAQLPILICSTHGKDRVGVISLLILSILGANNEATLTDYCASEAGLASFNMTRQIRLIPTAHRSGFDEDCVLLRANSLINDGVVFLLCRSCLTQVGMSPLLSACRPNTLRRILRFINRSYGTVEGYLDFIGFDANCRQQLRARLVHSSGPGKILYKTPAEAPFWTENPSILIPPKPTPTVPYLEPIMPNACMQRVMRVVSLLRLRDSFELEARDWQSGAWFKARRTLRRLRRQKHELESQASGSCRKNKVMAFEKTTLSRLSSLGSMCFSANSDIMSPTKSLGKRKSESIIQRLKQMREGLREIVAARRIVLQKLTDALLPLTRADIVKLLMYRNTQFYAERNQRIRVRRAPDIYDVYLDQPDLFLDTQTRRPEDVVRVVLKHLRLSQHMSALRTASFPSFFKEDAFQDDIIKRFEYQQKKSYVPKPRMMFIEPEYFFHELCDGSYKPRLTRTFSGMSSGVNVPNFPPPKTFGQWLMQCWMVPVDEAPPMRDPFEATRDECFVPPNVLAKYFRMQVQKGCLHKAFFQKDNTSRTSMETSFSAQSEALEDADLLPAVEEELYNENVFFDYLRQLVQKEVPSVDGSENLSSRSDEWTAASNVSSTIAYCQEPLFRYEQFDPVVAPSITNGAPDVYDAVDKDRERQWAGFIAVSRLLDSSNKMATKKSHKYLPNPNQYDTSLPSFLLPEEVPTHYDRLSAEFRMMAAKRRHRKRVHWDLKASSHRRARGSSAKLSSGASEDSSWSESLPLSSVNLPARLLSAQQRSASALPSYDELRPLPRRCYVELFDKEHEKSRTKASSRKAAALLRISTPFEAAHLAYVEDSEDALDFNSDDERDWIMQKVLNDDQVDGWWRYAENELVTAGVRRGQKSCLASDLRFPVKRNTVPKLDQQLVQWPTSAFGIHACERDDAEDGTDVYQVRHYARDLCEGTMIHDAARLNILKSSTTHC